MATAENEAALEGMAAPDARTMCEAFQATAARAPGDVALRNQDGSVEITWGDYADRVRSIAAGLAAIGVGRGDSVALMMSNRPEFQLCDTAAVHLGATPFSVYNTLAPDQISYLLRNSEAGVLLAEEQFVDRLKAAGASRIVCVDGSPEGTTSLEELEAGGAGDFDFEAAWGAVQPEDVLTLIYTSGTTGEPKGVEITHANMLAECRAMAQVLPIRPGDRITSYLPSAHIADRWSSHYNSMAFGIQITDVADMKQLAQVLPEVKPTLWGAVPRVVEKLKAGIEAAIAAEEDEERRAAVRKAIQVGTEKVRLEVAGEEVPGDLARAYQQLDETVLSKLRAQMGLDEARWIVVGAAPLARDVQEFFLAIGLPVTELYGMSEASCCVTVSPPERAKLGTVGEPIPSVEYMLAEDGELLIRGPLIMKGYRKEPEKTAEAIDEDGWLHTGDICQIDEDNHVKIVDRKKELIINAAGKNMSPANIEGELKSASPLIGQAVCIGDGRRYNAALLVLDPDAAAAYAKEHGLSDSSVEAVAADEGVQKAVAQAVEEANERMARVEQIKRWTLLHEEWLPGGDELTPTMKLKRKPIAEKHSDAIEALYEE